MLFKFYIKMSIITFLQIVPYQLLLIYILFLLPAFGQSIDSNLVKNDNLNSTSISNSYPTRPIHLIVPFPAGGGNDYIARFIANRLQGALKQSVIIDNKAGAGGLIGNEFAVKSVPDGYTLLLGSASYAINAALYPLKYDPLQDITAVAQFSRDAFILVANPSLNVQNITELISLAKARPYKVNIASSGEGSILHLSAELFMYKASIQLMHIPYKGGAQALNDTIAGHTQLFFSAPSVSVPFIKSGKLIALGVTTLNRMSAIGDIPSINESGIPGYEVNVWHGILAPKGLPTVITNKLNSEINRVILSNESLELLEKDGITGFGGSPEQFHQLITKEITLWKDIVKRANISIKQ